MVPSFSFLFLFFLLFFCPHFFLSFMITTHDFGMTRRGEGVDWKKLTSSTPHP